MPWVTREHTLELRGQVVASSDPKKSPAPLPEDGFLSHEEFTVRSVSSIVADCPTGVLASDCNPLNKAPNQLYHFVIFADVQSTAPTLARGERVHSFEPSSSREFRFSMNSLGYSPNRTPSRTMSIPALLVVATTSLDIWQLSRSKSPLGGVIPSNLSCYNSLEATLLQEYIDFGLKLPLRSEIVSMVPPLNKGNYWVPPIDIPGFVRPGYGIGVDGGLSGHYESVLSSYRGAKVRTKEGTLLVKGGDPVMIDAKAGVTINSGFRNPRRNLQAYADNNKLEAGLSSTSRHMWGCALDLFPEPTVGRAKDGGDVPLDRDEHLFPTLLEAARPHGSLVQAEKNGAKVDAGTPGEDHVHLQW